MSHQRLNDASAEPLDWQRILDDPHFRAMARRRRNTVVGLGIAAAIGYFSIPALIAWYPAFFAIRLAPGINVGIVFAVLQYPFGGAIAYAFLRRTERMDRSAATVSKQIATRIAEPMTALSQEESAHA
jgi:uncharacterized membrane protein (DUF485 family)